MEHDIRDIKGPVEISFEMGMLSWILLITFLIGLGVFLFYWFKKRKKGEQEEVIPSVPADLEALQKLDELVAMKLPECGKVQEYFFRLSAIVRHYLERCFGVPVSEQTTEEFLVELSQSYYLQEIQKQTLKSFLEHSDLVKFAKAQASSKECENGDKFARQLIEETRKKETI